MSGRFFEQNQRLDFVFHRFYFDNSGVSHTLPILQQLFFFPVFLYVFGDCCCPLHYMMISHKN